MSFSRHLHHASNLRPLLELRSVVGIGMADPQRLLEAARRAMRAGKARLEAAQQPIVRVA